MIFFWDVNGDLVEMIFDGMLNMCGLRQPLNYRYIMIWYIIEKPNI